MKNIRKNIFKFIMLGLIVMPIIMLAFKNSTNESSDGNLSSDNTCESVSSDSDYKIQRNPLRAVEKSPVRTLAENCTVKIISSSGDEVDSYSVRSGDTVTFKVTPNTGYQIYEVSAYLTTSSSQRPLTQSGDRYSFTLANIGPGYTYWCSAKAAPIRYTISCNYNGGSGSNQSYYLVTSGNVTLSNPTRNGYTFTGWTGSNGSTPQKNVTIPAGSTGDRSYTANWSANNYGINTSIGTGTSLSVSGSANCGDAVWFTANANPGYTNLSTIVYRQGNSSDRVAVYGSYFYMPAFPVTVQTTASLINYSISYNLNGGSMSGQTTSYNVTSGNIGLPTPTRTGYIFTGWTGSNGSTPQTSVTITSGSTGDRSYTANWKAIDYSITYDLAGGKLASSNPSSYTITSPTFTLVNPTKQGYRFVGWEGTGLSGSTEDVTIASGSTGNRSYKAIFESLMFNIDSTAGEGTTLNVLTNTLCGSKVEILAAANTGYDKLNIVVYKKGDKETLVEVTDNSFIMPAFDVVVETSASIANYTITYNLNGGIVEGNATSYTVLSEDIEVLNPTREGYIFAGWTGADLVEASDSVVIAAGSTGNKVYTANWTPIIYNVSSINNEGTTLAVSATAACGSTVTVAANLDRGYENLVINVYKVGEPETVVEVNGNTFEMPAFDVVVETSSSIINYTLTVDGVESTYTILSDTITINPVQKVGYNFLGFTGTNVSSLAQLVVIPTGSIGDREITSNYEAITYTLTVDGQTTTYTIESEDIVLDVLSKKGFNFLGYSGTDLEQMEQSVVIAQGSIGNKEYNTNFEIIEYTITYDDEKITYTVESEDIVLNETQKAGYTCLGITGTDLDEMVPSVVIPQGSIGDKEFVNQYSIITYTLTVDGQTSTYTVESEDIVLEEKSKTGYAFLGYSGTDLEENELTVVIPQGSIGDREYNTNFEIINYTIDFDGNITTYTILSETIIFNGEEKTGYKLLGLSGTGVDGVVKTIVIEHGSIGNKEIKTVYEAIEYTITLDGVQTIYTVESEDIVLEAPIKTGHKFTGFAGTDIDGKELNVVIPQGSTGNRVYFTNYEIGTYNIEKVNSNGTTLVAQDFAVYNSVVSFKTSISKDYENMSVVVYEAGNAENVIEVTNDSFVMPGFDVVIEVKASAITYTITYVLDGGEIVSANPSTYTVETGDITVINPEKLGYTFAGWTGTNLTEATTSLVIETETLGNRIYKANWTVNKYSIYFETNGGSSVDRITANYGSSVSAPANPTLEGYTFEGWYLDQDFNNRYVFDTMAAEDVTLYAKYNITVFQIQYYSDGQLISNFLYTYKDEIPVIEKNPTKEATAELSYTFSNWVLRNDSTDLVKKYDALYTTSIRTYEITWLDDNGAVLQKNTVKYGTTPKYEGTPLKKSDKQYDYDFVGWTEEILPVTENATYTAIFTAIEKVFVITFVDEKGNVIETKEVKYGQAVIAPHYDASMYVEEGYTSSFVGWDIKNELDEVTENKTAHAIVKKEAIKYTINYWLDGGSNAAANPNNYTVEDSITLEEPTREGYEFEGWQIEGSNETITDLSILKGTTGDLTIKSVWAKTDNVKDLTALNVVLLTACVAEVAALAMMLIKNKKNKGLKARSVVLAPTILSFVRSQLNTTIGLSTVAAVLLVAIIALAIMMKKKKAMQPVADNVQPSSVVNNYFININEKDDSDDEDDIEEVEVVDQEEMLAIEESITDYVEPTVEDKKTSAPRHLTLKLRLSNSSDQLKSRYSTIRNYIESYKIRQKSSKHKDDYYIKSEVVINDQDENFLNKKINKKILMITVRRKQLILSFNFADSFLAANEDIMSRNIVIEQRRYNDFNFNMRLSNQSDVEFARGLIEKIMSQNEISLKKKHKDIDYTAELNTPYSSFERKGFGYLVRPSVTLEEADQYTNSLAVRSLIINKINEHVEDSANPFEISLDLLNDNFKDSTHIDLDFLKEAGMAPADSNKLIITNGKYLNKRFVIDADGYSANTVKMVFLTGGEARINKRLSK